MNLDELPTVSICIPTLNCAKLLQQCLAAIAAQDFPSAKLEIIVADGGSTDETVEVARAFSVTHIVSNPLKTGEAGKAAALRYASGEIVAFVDSDNIMTTTNWLARMLQPFFDCPEVIAAEPIGFEWQQSDTIVNRYCALMGVNDPLCVYLENYVHFSRLTGRWTGVPVTIEARAGYEVARFRRREFVPALGANGFFIRRDILTSIVQDTDYLFDVDILPILLDQDDRAVAKVHVNIHHLYAQTWLQFQRKQRRRIRDFLHFSRNGQRTYPWGHERRGGLVRFVLSTVFVVPLFVTATRGYLRCRDRAWFFHVPACWITLLTYGTYVLMPRSLQNVERR